MQTTFLYQIRRTVFAYFFHFPVQAARTDCQPVGNITGSQFFVRYVIIDYLQNRLKEFLRLLMRQLSVRLFKRTDRRTEVVLQHFFPFHHLPHRYTEIFCIKRFRDIHLRTCRKRRHLFFHLMPPGYDYNRDMSRFLHRLNPFRELNATNSRHHDIKDYHIRIHFVHHLFHPFGVLQGDYIKITGEDFSDKPQHLYLIIDYQ